jgi:hypothetical protein
VHLLWEVSSVPRLGVHTIYRHILYIEVSLVPRLGGVCVSPASAPETVSSPNLSMSGGLSV